MGKIARKSKFWGQLKVKLKNFTANDQYAKASNYRGSID